MRRGAACARTLTAGAAIATAAAPVARKARRLRPLDANGSTQQLQPGNNRRVSDIMSSDGISVLLRLSGRSAYPSDTPAATAPAVSRHRETARHCRAERPGTG